MSDTRRMEARVDGLRKYTLPAPILLIGFTSTLFLSALLMFAVQPMFAKMVLPVLGGSPAVWSVAMCFFSGGAARRLRLRPLAQQNGTYAARRDYPSRRHHAGDIRAPPRHRRGLVAPARRGSSFLGAWPVRGIHRFAILRAGRQRATAPGLVCPHRAPATRATRIFSTAPAILALFWPCSAIRS